MVNPLATLHVRLQAAIADALGLDFADADPVLRPSAPGQFGDFQANAAMALGKRAGRPPRDIAAAIVDAADLDDLCSLVEVAGPGFINLSLRPETLATATDELLDDARLSVARADPAERVVIDYSAPNVAKEMHVGHIRSKIIGDSIARTLEFLGHAVVRQNHFGDWGTQFGMLIEHLVDIGEDQAVRELSVGDLTTFYQDARVKFDGDEAFADRSRQRVVVLQAGDQETLALWRILFDASKAYTDAVYDRLGVTLTDDDIAAESSYNDLLDDVATELESTGLARLDEGALCAFPEGFVGRDGDALPLMVRKTDGGYGYQATDLAAIRHRAGTLAADRIIYVVGAPQSQHLSMVFTVAADAGWTSDVRVEHVSFGSVLGEDRKMLATRAGKSVKLSDLLDEAVERAEATIAEKNPDLDADTRALVARQVGIGAVKYADLSSDRVKDYVFDFDRMLAFEGNTGPYLQYAHARIRSIFRRGEGGGGPPVLGPIAITEDAERALALHLLGFGAVVETCAETLQPHRLCVYLFDLAQAFTTFYEACPVLRAPDEVTRASRFSLCELTAQTLRTGLGLLGIEAPDRM
ncbi:MAG: arginine--tRNA ligase [Acidimicrobiales bacterium]